VVDRGYFNSTQTFTNGRKRTTSTIVSHLPCFCCLPLSFARAGVLVCPLFLSRFFFCCVCLCVFLNIQCVTSFCFCFSAFLLLKRLLSFLSLPFHTSCSFISLLFVFKVVSTENTAAEGDILLSASSNPSVHCKRTQTHKKTTSTPVLCQALESAPLFFVLYIFLNSLFFVRVRSVRPSVCVGASLVLFFCSSTFSFHRLSLFPFPLFFFVVAARPPPRGAHGGKTTKRAAELSPLWA
jgi:hypothetical protein